MTDAEYILALEDLLKSDAPSQFVWEWRSSSSMTRRVLRAHVEDWWEKNRTTHESCTPKPNTYQDASQPVSSFRWVDSVELEEKGLPEGWEIAIAKPFHFRQTLI